jgi:hypothetical protein
MNRSVYYASVLFTANHFLLASNTLTYYAMEYITASKYFDTFYYCLHFSYCSEMT